MASYTEQQQHPSQGDSVQKVYVDWPEEDDNEDYRFVSSRMDDLSGDPLPTASAVSRRQPSIHSQTKQDQKRQEVQPSSDIRKGSQNHQNGGNPQPEQNAVTRPSQVVTNKRLEALRRQTEASAGGRAVPPLNLMSRSSSIDFAGARGSIDINLRSDDEEEDDEEEELKFVQDSLELDPGEENTPDETDQAPPGGPYNGDPTGSNPGPHTTQEREMNDVLSRVAGNVDDLTLQPDLYDTSRNPPDTTTQPSEYSARTFGDSEAPLAVGDVDFLRKLKEDYVYGLQSAPFNYQTGQTMPVLVPTPPSQESQHKQYVTSSPRASLPSKPPAGPTDNSPSSSQSQSKPSETAPGGAGRDPKGRRGRHPPPVAQPRHISISAPPQVGAKPQGGKKPPAKPNTAFKAQTTMPAAEVDYVALNKRALQQIGGGNKASYTNLYRGQKETSPRRYVGPVNPAAPHQRVEPTSPTGEISVEQFWMARARFLADTTTSAADKSPSKRTAQRPAPGKQPIKMENNYPAPNYVEQYASRQTLEDEYFYPTAPEAQLRPHQFEGSYYPGETHVSYNAPSHRGEWYDPVYSGQQQPYQSQPIREEIAHTHYDPYVNQQSYPSYDPQRNEEQAWTEIEAEFGSYIHSRKHAHTTEVPGSDHRGTSMSPTRQKAAIYDSRTLEEQFRHLSPQPAPPLKRTMSNRYPPLPPIQSPRKTDHVTVPPEGAGGSYTTKFQREKEGPRYRKYTMHDYQNMKNIDRVGGLGPDLSNDTYKFRREKAVRQRDYAIKVNEQNISQFERSRGFRDPSPSGMQTSSPPPQPGTKLGGSPSPAMDQAGEPSDSKEGYYYDTRTKRQVMMEYAKNLQTRRKPSSFSEGQGQNEGHVSRKEKHDRGGHSNGKRTSPERTKVINNTDLDRMLQRHEEEKRAAEAIRQTLSKV